MEHKSSRGQGEKFLADYEPLAVSRRRQEDVAASVEFVQKRIGPLFRVPYSEATKRREYFGFSRFLSDNME
jgi:hypothetical protein